MLVTHSFLDINKMATENLAEILPISVQDSWMIITAPIISDKDHIPEWSPSYPSDRIRIPLFPYCTISQEPVFLPTLGAMLAGRAMVSLMEGFCKAPFQPIRLHFSWGAPIEALEQYLRLDPTDEPRDCYRVWLGMALQINSFNK